MSCGQTQRGFRRDCETRLLLNTQYAYILYVYKVYFYLKHILTFFLFLITIRNTFWMFGVATHKITFLHCCRQSDVSVCIGVIKGAKKDLTSPL